MNLSKSIIYILIAIGGIAVGFAGTKLFSKKCTTVYLPSEVVTVYRDTCQSLDIIADVTTETFEDNSTEIKKGKPQKDISKVPVESVEKEDSTYTTKFTKDYDFGLVKLKVKTTVKAKSAATAENEIDWILDTITLKKMTTIVNTVVVSKDTLEKVPDSVVKYLPVTLDAPKETWVGLGGSIMSTPNGLKYDAGISTRFNKTSVGVFKDPTTDFGKFEGYRIQITRDLLRVSKN